MQGSKAALELELSWFRMQYPCRADDDRGQVGLDIFWRNCSGFKSVLGPVLVQSCVMGIHFDDLTLQLHSLTSKLMKFTQS